MNSACLVALLFLALVSCGLSSYLDIPPPPERPLRFKTREQIETYLKAIKDYYDAFKIKLVRRDSSLYDVYTPAEKTIEDNNNNNNNEEDDNENTTDYELNYFVKELPRNSYTRRRYKVNKLMNT